MKSSCIVAMTLVLSLRLQNLSVTMLGMIGNTLAPSCNYLAPASVFWERIKDIYPEMKLDMIVGTATASNITQIVCSEEGIRTGSSIERK